MVTRNSDHILTTTVVCGVFSKNKWPYHDSTHSTSDLLPRRFEPLKTIENI